MKSLIRRHWKSFILIPLLFIWKIFENKAQRFAESYFDSWIDAVGFNWVKSATPYVHSTAQMAISALPIISWGVISIIILIYAAWGCRVILHSYRQRHRSHLQFPPLDQTAEEKGYLDYVAEGSVASRSLESVILSLASDTNWIAGRISVHTKALAKIKKRNRRDSNEKARLLAIATAHDLDAYSKKSGPKLEIIHVNGSSFIENARGYVRIREFVTEEQISDLRGLGESTAVFSTALNTMINSLASFHKSALGMRGVEQNLNRSIREFDSIFKAGEDYLVSISNLAGQLIAEIDEKLSSKSNPSEN